VLGEKDNITPAALAMKAAKRMPSAEILSMPVGHFEVYSGEPFEQAAEAEADFFARHLAAV
jgi:hypothetical protein